MQRSAGQVYRNYPRDHIRRFATRNDKPTGITSKKRKMFSLYKVCPWHHHTILRGAQKNICMALALRSVYEVQNPNFQEVIIIAKFNDNFNHDFTNASNSSAIEKLWTRK